MSHFLFTVRLWAEKSGELVWMCTVTGRGRVRMERRRKHRRQDGGGGGGGGMTKGAEDRAEKILGR